MEGTRERQDGAPRWVGWWFRGAALYGAVALLPTYLANATLAEHGFTGTALAFQIAFWIIGGAPVRHRPLMLVGVAEKLAFGVPAILFAATGRAPAIVAAFGAIDLALGAGFLLAWRATPPITRGS